MRESARFAPRLRDSLNANSSFVLITSLLLCLICRETAAQDSEEAVPTSSLKRLSLSELMELEVTSVSRRPERLGDAASAVQVITGDDIRRSGATRIPEALRLASNLHVAQRGANTWAISARGFNTTVTNKLLVLMDGRSLYSPLFAGVFWDVQDTLLEDVDRIEVISGPGATAWGANAVNGVISITTKPAVDTRGLLLLADGGSEIESIAGARFGGAVGSQLQYRVYGKYLDLDSAVAASGSDGADGWRIGRGGFRLDWQPGPADSFTLQGDHHDATTGPAGPSRDVMRGSHLIARWTQRTSETSDLELQVYYDRAFRRSPGRFADHLDTYDVDFQQRLRVGERHDVVWGLAHRLIEDRFEDSPMLALLPLRVSRRWYSAFLQDEIALPGDRWHLTLGAKLEHNDYTDFELQPSIRIASRVREDDTLWAAVSRAVRVPSRVDREFFQPGAPPFIIAGGPGFDSEELLAYELGYRLQADRMSMAVAAFYNDYDKLRSLEPVNPPAPVPIEIRNGFEAHSYGAELTAEYRPVERWRLTAGFRHLQLKFDNRPGSLDPSGGDTESRDPERQFLLRSSIDLPRGLELDATYRHVSRIVNQDVPAYGELDLRFGWRLSKQLEISVVGQNLLHDQHAEFGSLPLRTEIERNIHGRILWGF